MLIRFMVCFIGFLFRCWVFERRSILIFLCVPAGFLATLFVSPLLWRHLFSHLTLFRSHRLFGHDGRWLIDRYLGADSEAPYQNALLVGMVSFGLLAATRGLGKELLYVSGADGFVYEIALLTMSARTVSTSLTGEQYTGNVRASIRLFGAAYSSLFAHWHGRVRSACR